MADTNYVSSIVRILEDPKHMILKNTISITEFRAQFPQVRNTQIVNLVFWGKLARDVADHYKIDDYILIEGYCSLLSKSSFKRVQIVALKVYPFLSSQDH